MEERRQHNLELADKIDDIALDVKHILHVLNGNGEKGVVAKVIDHETYLAEHKELWGKVKLTALLTVLVSVITAAMIMIGIPK